MLLRVSMRFSRVLSVLKFLRPAMMFALKSFILLLMYVFVWSLMLFRLLLMCSVLLSCSSSRCRLFLRVKLASPLWFRLVRPLALSPKVMMRSF